MTFSKYIYSIICFFSLITIISCKNDIKNVIKVEEVEKMPELLGDEISLRQSENGQIILSVYAKEFVKFSNENKKLTEFPKGIQVVHFSKYPDTLSKISSNYAVNYDDKELWEAKGNVVAKNTKNEILNTEYLVWDQKKRIIYSNKHVQVTTPNDIIMGEGFESDEQFNNWKITKVTGIFTIDEQTE